MVTEWKAKYPLVTVRALERIEVLFDHATILLDVGVTKLYGKKAQFKCELCRLHREG